MPVRAAHESAQGRDEVVAQAIGYEEAEHAGDDCERLELLQGQPRVLLDGGSRGL